MPDGSVQKGREIIKYVAGKKIEFDTEEKIFKEFPAKINVECVIGADSKIEVVPVITGTKKESPKLPEKETDPKDYANVTMEEINQGIKNLTKQFSQKV